MAPSSMLPIRRKPPFQGSIAWLPLPGLGNHHHDGLGQRKDPVHDQAAPSTLSKAAESEPPSSTIGNESLQLIAKEVGGQDALARSHPVLVAAEGVDLTVVGKPSQAAVIDPRRGMCWSRT